jgi:hypothetical protein
MAGIFIKTWKTHGFWEWHTAVAGAFFVVFVFLMLVLICGWAVGPDLTDRK